MTALLELQRQFRNAVLGATPPPEDVLGGVVSAAARMGVYRNTIMGNLTGALRLTYPAIERLVGEAFFAAACRDFIAAAPPGDADLYRYGAGFAAFLARFAPAMALAYLPDVARLEWAVVQALHAPPAAPLDLVRLVAIPPTRRADLIFMPHPTLSLLALTTPARAIWQAVLMADDAQRAAALAAIEPSGGGERLAVLRPWDALIVLPLTPSVFSVAHALAGGARIADALAEIGFADASSALADLLAHGVFAGIKDDNNPQPRGTDVWHDTI